MADEGADWRARVRGTARWLRTPTGTVAVLVVLAFGLRLPLLGARVAHWDEARVAWWILEYRETGYWRYFPILHGPFLFHVERWLFGVLGTSDAVMRLPLAVVGGLLPAAAIWYRDHLHDREVVALALLLAVAPLLVFYSRFMRSDLLVAAFAFAGIGALLRAHATGRRRYGIAAALLVALAFTAKENAVLYLLSWVGAAGTVEVGAGLRASERRAGLRSLLARDRRAGPRSLLSGDPWYRLRSTVAVDRSTAIHWLPAVLGGAVVFLAVVVAFYAPRLPAPGAGFDDLAAHPGSLPGLALEATVGSAGRMVDLWVTGGLQEHSYLHFLGLLAGMLVVTAPSTLALALYGAYREWGSDRRPRWLVAFALAWAGLGLAGYPAAVDIVAGWTSIHVVVPLTLPAAVGLVGLVDRVSPVVQEVRSGRDGAAGGWDRRRVLAVVGLGLVVVHLAAVGPAANYAAPGHRWNPYPQPAQPPDTARATVDAVAHVAATTEGPAVAYVGESFEGGMLSRLPLAWYVRRAGGSARWYPNATALPDSPPPIVVAREPHHDDLAARLDGYRCHRVLLVAWAGHGPRGSQPQTHVYVREGAVPDDYGPTRSSQRCG